MPDTARDCAVPYGVRPCKYRGSYLPLQFPEPEVQGDLFFCGQCHTLHGGGQHLAARGGSGLKALHQLWGLTAALLRREVRPANLGQPLFRRHPSVGPLKACLVQQAGLLISKYIICLLR